MGMTTKEIIDYCRYPFALDEIRRGCVNELNSECLLTIEEINELAKKAAENFIPGWE